MIIAHVPFLVFQTLCTLLPIHMYTQLFYRHLNSPSKQYGITNDN